MGNYKKSELQDSQIATSYHKNVNHMSKSHAK